MLRWSISGANGFSLHLARKNRPFSLSNSMWSILAPTPSLPRTCTTKDMMRINWVHIESYHIIIMCYTPYTSVCQVAVIEIISVAATRITCFEGGPFQRGQGLLIQGWHHCHTSRKTRSHVFGWDEFCLSVWQSGLSGLLCESQVARRKGED